MKQMLKTSLQCEPLGKASATSHTLCPRGFKQQPLIITGSEPTPIIIGIMAKVGFAKNIDLFLYHH